MRSLTRAGQTAWKPRRILKAALLSGFCLWSVYCGVNAAGWPSAYRLQLSARPSATEVAVNDTLTYTIILNNPYTTTLDVFQFVVVIPQGMADVVTPLGSREWNCRLSDDRATTVCRLPHGTQLLPGGHAEARFSVTARSEGGFTPIILVTAFEGWRGGDWVSNSASDVLRPTVSFRPAPPDLDVTHAARPEPVFADGDLTYTTSVANVGVGSANDTTLTIALPAGVEYRSVTPVSSCEPTSLPRPDRDGLITCHLKTIGRAEPGRTPSIAVTTIVRPMPTGTIRSRAEATAVAASPLSADRYTSNNSRIATTTINPSADLALVKTASVVSGLHGSDVTYQLTVTNNGPSPATNVVVTDNLPLTGVSRTPTPMPVSPTATPPAVTLVSSPASCTLAGATLTCNLGNLAGGTTRGSATITVMLRVTDTRTLTNTASVRANEHDSVTANNTATIPTMVVRPPQSGRLEGVPEVPAQSSPKGPPPPRPMIPAKPPLPGAPSKSPSAPSK